MSTPGRPASTCCAAGPQTRSKGRSLVPRGHSAIRQGRPLSPDASGNPLGWDEPLTEAGRKDTVIAYPGQITRVKALYDRPGLFVWHCHIVEHEQHEMMRPYRIAP
jgi:FtsP/CotA-like multicopper oxidase with cupredoxin domain